MFKPTSTRLSRRLRRSVIAGVTAGTALAIGVTGVASASVRPVAAPAATKSPVLVGPLLDVFNFGLSIGVPLGCQTVSGSVGSAGGEYNVNLNSLVSEINTVCGDITTDGSKLVALGMASDTPLAALDPAANSVIGEAASTLSTLGSEYGDSLAPFGPTIAGAGPFIKYFEGS